MKTLSTLRYHDSKERMDDEPTRGWDFLFCKKSSVKFCTNQIFLPEKSFCTGSKYLGTWDKLGMDGYGIYTFPHGVKAQGNFKDGEFNNEVTLIYPLGDEIIGNWSQGTLISWKYKFRCGLEFSHPWDYCKYPDRRFYISRNKGMRPAGRELLTADPVARPIPKDCYDVGEGFYNPHLKCIISALDETKVLRIPNVEEEKWIKQNCRKAWTESVGYRPDLYEDWSTGRQSEIDAILEKVEKKND